MNQHWILLFSFLSIVGSQSVAHGEEVVTGISLEPTPALPAIPRRIIPRSSTVVGSTALAFFKVAESGELADAERTSVRVVQGVRIVQTRRVELGGVAQIADVAPGVYTVIASGPEGIAASGISLGGEGSRVPPNAVNPFSRRGHS